MKSAQCPKAEPPLCLPSSLQQESCLQLSHDRTRYQTVRDASTLQSPCRCPHPPSVQRLPALVNNPSLTPPNCSQAFCPALPPPFSPEWPLCFSTWFSWCRCPLLLGNLSNKLFLVVVICLLPCGTQIRTNLKHNLHINRAGRISRRVKKSLNVPDKHSAVPYAPMGSTF